MKKSGYLQRIGQAIHGSEPLAALNQSVLVSVPIQDEGPFSSTPASKPRGPRSSTRSTQESSHHLEARNQIASFYDQDSQALYRMLRGLGVAGAELEDALQDVLLIAYQKYAKFEGRSQFRTWVFGIAVRVAKKYRRRAAKTTESLDDVPPGKLLTASLTSTQDARQLTQAVLRSVGPKQREIIYLVEFGGFSIVEAAQILNLNPNTAYARHRVGKQSFEVAIQELKEEFQREGNNP